MTLELPNSAYAEPAALLTVLVFMTAARCSLEYIFRAMPVVRSSNDPQHCINDPQGVVRDVKGVEALDETHTRI